jgi:hypothetical protein
MNRLRVRALRVRVVQVEVVMGNLAAIAGVVLLLLGVALVALRGDRGSSSWAAYVGVALAVLGLGVEVIGAVALAA